MRKAFNAGKLRHLVRIEAPVLTQDPTTGATTTTWTPVVEVHASIEPLSVRDFIAAQSLKSQIAARITIRYRPGLTADMRLIAADGTIYKPAGWLPDADSGREYLTAPCTC